ncbi:MAG: tetraacyldisaccharide 4'-kinase [Betaproteobacteria bacterium]
MTIADRLVRSWYSPRLTLLAALLWPLSILYRAVVGGRRMLYRAGWLRAIRLPVPVVIVGNITVGGAGKTPLTCAIAAALRERGWHPGIVSRGYGGSADSARAVALADDPRVVGDEPLIFAAMGLPVWIGRDRVAAGAGLLATHAECNVILADDGLQHYRLARTMEIVAIDDARGLGNGCLLPAGPLREPACRLQQVDAVVRLMAPDVRYPAAASGRMTRTHHRALPWRNLVEPHRVADPSTWRSGDVHAVCGTANPARFFAMLRTLGIAAHEHAFADHHFFVAADLAWPNAAAILMTEKDAVKCRGIADARCWYLPVQAQVDPALIALVEETIRGFKAA